jgi:hypothetical protein
MTKYVQLTASFKILDDEDAEAAAEHYAFSVRDAAFDSPFATSFRVHTVIADRPLPRPTDEADEPNLGVHIAGPEGLDVAGAIALATDPYGRRSEDT